MELLIGYQENYSSVWEKNSSVNYSQLTHTSNITANQRCHSYFKLLIVYLAKSYCSLNQDYKPHLYWFLKVQSAVCFQKEDLAKEELETQTEGKMIDAHWQTFKEIHFDHNHTSLTNALTILPTQVQDLIYCKRLL